MKKQFVPPRHAPRKTGICSVVLKKVASTSGTVLTLVVESASTIRELAVYTHTNRWFLATERVPRKIGQFLKKAHLRRFFLDQDQSVKVLGVYDPADERRLGFVERQIRRLEKALAECHFGLAFAHETR
ncbi:MAG: hypothetical protein RLZZ347_658 [Candidatus Parcubacteria bacterium]|jgi:hypothetical protein